MCQGFQCRPVNGRVQLKIEVDPQNVRVWRAPIAPAGATAAPAASRHLARWLSDLFCCGVLCRDCAIRAYGIGVWEVLGRPPGFLQVAVVESGTGGSAGQAGSGANVPVVTEPTKTHDSERRATKPNLFARLIDWIHGGPPL